MRLMAQPEPEVIRKARETTETMLQSLARQYEKPMRDAERIADPERRHQKMQQLRNDYHEMAHRLQKPLRDIIALTPLPIVLIKDDPA